RNSNREFNKGETGGGSSRIVTVLQGHPGFWLTNRARLFSHVVFVVTMEIRAQNVPVFPSFTKSKTARAPI
ncbi:MAG: hypothetical protein ACXWG7_02215, partial [Chthoniobacterales bacterium]